MIEINIFKIVIFKYQKDKHMVLSYNYPNYRVINFFLFIYLLFLLIDKKYFVIKNLQ